MFDISTWFYPMFALILAPSTIQYSTNVLNGLRKRPVVSKNIGFDIFASMLDQSANLFANSDLKR